MTGPSKRGNPLAVMLLISAIDVLLCAFTATITLFFLGGGHATGATNDEIGWAGLLVIAQSDQSLQLTTDFPNEALEPSRAFRLDSLPTVLRPARFRLVQAIAADVALDVTIVSEGRTELKRVTCPAGYSGSIFRVDDAAGMVRPEAGCR
jgi:hypothetical protein